MSLKSVKKPVEKTLKFFEDAGPAASDLIVPGFCDQLPVAQQTKAEKNFVVVGHANKLEVKGPDLIVESVIGDQDDRRFILETDQTPWNKICSLRITNQFGEKIGIGTGWLAGPKTVITAGHCVHNQVVGGWVPRIEVIPGRNGIEFPFDQRTSTKFSSIDQWVDSALRDYDIGCIHLEEPFEDGLGWFSYAAISSAELTRHLVNISGYPEDLGLGTLQLFHANRITHVGERRLFYDVDTNKGQSGAPVFIKRDRESPPIVVGIHAYGIGGSTHLPIEANSSPWILPDVFELINQWVEEDET